MAPSRKDHEDEIKSVPHCLDEGVEDDVVEEIVEKVEDSVILIRFPCFDFFRNTHICESRLRPSGIPPSDPSGSDGAHGYDFIFDPTLLQVDSSSSLDAPHPILVLNKGTDKEVKFVGSWEESEYSMKGANSHGVNRAVILLGQHREVEEESQNNKIPKYELGQSRTEKIESNSPNGEGKTIDKALVPASSSTFSSAISPSSLSSPFSLSKHNDKDSKKGSTAQPASSSYRGGMEVASLFSHAEAGLTADEARENKAKVIDTVYVKDIFVPSSILVLHPLS